MMKWPRLFLLLNGIAGCAALFPLESGEPASDGGADGDGDADGDIDADGDTDGDGDGGLGCGAVCATDTTCDCNLGNIEEPAHAAYLECLESVDCSTGSRLDCAGTAAIGHEATPLVTSCHGAVGGTCDNLACDGASVFTGAMAKVAATCYALLGSTCDDVRACLDNAFALCR